jgi:glutamate synthase (NADPH/NADH) small chain
MDLDYDQISKDAKTALDAILARTEPLKPKDRMAIPAQPMATQRPEARVKNMSEVSLGYSAEQARVEAERCLQCKTAPCVAGCPVAIDIHAFVQSIADNDFKASVDIIKRSSLLPAICGRVCPQEVQCQVGCTVGKVLKDVDASVSIGRLERFVADYERETGAIDIPTVKPETGKKVAIIGSGPASITVAADVRREGHAVTVFEAFHKPGGVMMYGIPEFRLPKEIVQQEISTLRDMGIEIQTNYVVGRTRKLADLLSNDGFDAVFVGTGAGLPKFMNFPGENLVGVYSANEYLTRVNLMRAFDSENADTPVLPSKCTVVLGGGNVAMDAARCSVRMGAKEVHLVYRRTEKEMPARNEEIEHAKEEGVHFHLLENAIAAKGDSYGRVNSLTCLRYELGEPDASGRRRPVEIAGSEFEMDVDCVIVAIGNDSNPLIKQTTPEIETNRWGNIVVDDGGKTTMDRVYAGGDIVLGAATVILAMGEGRRAAASINALLA